MSKPLMASEDVSSDIAMNAAVSFRAAQIASQLWADEKFHTDDKGRLPLFSIARTIGTL